MKRAPDLRQLEIDDLTVAYRELGDGPPVLLVHGWPTSSHLWRNIMPSIARHNRVIAIDLPGFGGSAKPLDTSYDSAFFEGAIDGLLDQLDVGPVALGVHDLGGPVGVHWALRNRSRVTRLALLNTLVYPEFSEAVQEFVIACLTPELRDELTSPAGLEEAMRVGLADRASLTDEVLAAVIEPFDSADSRLALAKAGVGIELNSFSEIASELPGFDAPVLIVYGTEDRILPDVAETMARVAADLPQAEVKPLPECGHFLQEEDPEEIGRLLAEFFTGDRD
jgi:pimeloyl-ACP methyl ester carboxylesterase